MPAAPYLLPYNNRPQAIVWFYDVSNPVAPVLKATVSFEGTIADSRLIGSKLHLVLQTTPILPDNPTPAVLRAGPRRLDSRLQGHRGRRRHHQFGRHRRLGARVPPRRPRRLQHRHRGDAGCGSAFGTFHLYVHHGRCRHDYASKDALYITDTNYSWTSFTLRVDTAIHKLAFTDGGTEYRASGLVPGRPLNSYSLGEFNGNLRIATHIDTEFLVAIESRDATAAVGRRRVANA